MLLKYSINNNSINEIDTCTINYFNLKLEFFMIASVVVKEDKISAKKTKNPARL